MLDKYIDQHKRPICFWFHIVGFIVLIYALWVQSWTLIVVAVILFILGHLFAGSGKTEEIAPRSEPTPPSETPESSEPTEPTGY